MVYFRLSAEGDSPSRVSGPSWLRVPSWTIPAGKVTAARSASYHQRREDQLTRHTLYNAISQLAHSAEVHHVDERPGADS